MMGIEQVIISVIMVSSLVSMASAVPGTATFFTTSVVSSCYGNEDQGRMIAAANPSLFNNTAACGAFFKVRCIGSTTTPPACRRGEVRVKIVDLCPACQPDQLDLSLEAFSVIANPDAGRIRIDYVRD